MDTSVAAGTAVHPRLLSPRRRWEGPFRRHPRVVHVLCGPQVRTDTLQGRSTLGTRYVLRIVKLENLERNHKLRYLAHTISHRDSRLSHLVEYQSGPDGHV